MESTSRSLVSTPEDIFLFIYIQVMFQENNVLPLQSLASYISMVVLVVVVFVMSLLAVEGEIVCRLHS